MEVFLLWTVRIGLWLLLFTPLIVAGNLFFPYVTGKNFFFRIVVDIVFGVWFALAILNPAFRPRWGKMLGAFAIFVAVLALATLFGADPYHSFWSNFERMEGLVTHLHLFALFIIASSVLRTEKDWRVLFHVSLGVSFLVSVIGLLERLGTVQLGGSVGGSAGAARIFSTLGNPIYLAIYLLIHFFILAYLFSRTRALWLRITYSALFVFEGYIFIAAGTRGAIIGLATGVLAALAALLFLVPSRRLRMAAGAGLLLLLAVAGSLILVKNSAFVRSRPLLVRISDINLSSSTVQSRFMIWGIAGEAMRERPLLGWGPENFILPYAKYYNPLLFGNEPWFDRVHNMHLEWLVAGGIIGFVAYAALYVIAFITLWQLWRRNVFDAWATAVFAGLIVAYLLQNFFVFDTIITYLFMTLLLAFLHSMMAASEPIQSTVSRVIRRSESALFLAPLSVVGGILLAVVLNARPVSVAAGIIDTLNTTSQPGKTVVDVVAAYDMTAAKGTFGLTELRERLSDLIIQTAGQVNPPNESFVNLLTKGIEEIQGEVERNPSAIRHSMALGKLLQVRFVFTRSEQDRDAAVAAYEQAMRVAPHYPSVAIGLAEVYLAAGRPDKAAETMDAVYSTIDRPSKLFQPTLVVYVLAGDFERASRYAETFLQYRIEEGHPIMQGFDRELAEEAARRSLVGGDAAAREKFLKVLLKGLPNNENPIVFLALAETYAQLGNTGEARAYAERARSIAPEYAGEIDEFLKNLAALP